MLQQHYNIAAMLLQYDNNVLRCRYLVFVHVDVALYVVIAANLIELHISEGVLLNKEQQLVELFLLLEEVHVGGFAGDAQSLRHA